MGLIFIIMKKFFNFLKKNIIYILFLIVFDTTCILFFLKCFFYKEYLFLLEQIPSFFNYYEFLVKSFLHKNFLKMSFYFENNIDYYKIFLVYFAFFIGFLDLTYIITKKICYGLYLLIFLFFDSINILFLSIINSIPKEFIMVDLLMKIIFTYLNILDVFFYPNFFLFAVIIIVSFCSAFIQINYLLITTLFFNFYQFIINIFSEIKIAKIIINVLAIFFYNIHKNIINIIQDPSFLYSECINNIFNFCAFFKNAFFSILFILYPNFFKFWIIIIIIIIIFYLIRQLFYFKKYK